MRSDPYCVKSPQKPIRVTQSTCVMHTLRAAGRGAHCPSVFVRRSFYFIGYRPRTHCKCSKCACSPVWLPPPPASGLPGEFSPNLPEPVLGRLQVLRFRNSFVFTTRPPRDAAPSCRSCPSRPQGRRHMCQCARSAGSRWVPQSKRSLHCSARSHCGAAPRRRSMSGLQGQRFSAARGLRQGPGRPHGAPEAAGVASLMTCATRRRGQLRFHNAPHFGTLKKRNKRHKTTPAVV